MYNKKMHAAVPSPALPCLAAPRLASPRLASRRVASRRVRVRGYSLQTTGVRLEHLSPVKRLWAGARARNLLY